MQEWLHNNINKTVYFPTFKCVCKYLVHEIKTLTFARLLLLKFYNSTVQPLNSEECY